MLLDSRQFKALYKRAFNQGGKDEADMYLAAMPLYKFAPVRGSVQGELSCNSARAISLQAKAASATATDDSDDTMPPLRFTITDNGVDHYGDRVFAAGGETDWWTMHGSFQFGHCYWDIYDTVGAPVSVEKMPTEAPIRIEAVIRFVPRAISEKAYATYQMYRQGFLSGCSIGLLVKAWTEVNDRPGWAPWDITRWFLLETSGTSIPANPNAVLKAIEQLGDIAGKAMADMADSSQPNDPASALLKDAVHRANGSPVSITAKRTAYQEMLLRALLQETKG